MGIKRESKYSWHFKSIKAIIDGRTNKAEDMVDRKNAMRKFREQVPELNWIEHMKPRSDVSDRKLWPYGR
jgi:hypothetical protein